MKQKVPVLLLTVSLVVLLAAAGLLYAHFSSRFAPAQPERSEASAVEATEENLRSAPDFTVIEPL